MDKATQRNMIKAKLNELSVEKHRELSALIIERLAQDPDFISANTIGLTISAFPEVDTKLLIERIWQEGKRAAVPKCIPKSRGMDFYIIDNFDQLEVVYMNLQEPQPAITQYAAPDEIDLMIVPGVAYCRSGYRIGFGGGYYDRYLTGFNGHTKSIAFDVQLVESIEVESHDIPVEGVYTERGYFETGKVSR